MKFSIKRIPNISIIKTCITFISRRSFCYYCIFCPKRFLRLIDNRVLKFLLPSSTWETFCPVFDLSIISEKLWIFYSHWFFIKKICTSINLVEEELSFYLLLFLRNDWKYSVTFRGLGIVSVNFVRNNCRSFFYWCFIEYYLLFLADPIRWW